MNKKVTYFITIVLFVVAIAFVFIRFKNKEEQSTSFQLKERRGALSQSKEFIQTRAKAARLKMILQEKPEDEKSGLALSAIYIQEARITGDHVYYNMAAMHHINNTLKKDSNNFEALTYKALVYLSQHHFEEGRVVAEKAKSIIPFNAFIYGILVDANIEMGNYTKAVDYSDSMVSIRPDIRSYSRISYLREIHGDYPGAIEAMNMAVKAGLPGDEGTAWARVQLGHLYENTGDMNSAEMHYTIALNERPNYAYALAGLAHIATAEKDYPKAINYYLKADSLVTDYVFKEELVDVYRLTGESSKAELMSKIVIEEMSKHAKTGLIDDAGHYADKELAYAYLKIKNYDKALLHALAEYNRRPKNIDVNETVAWVYYNLNKPEKALPYLKEALKTNSKNPVLLCHAGLIYAKTDQKDMAKSFLQEALKNNPNIAPDLRIESEQVLQSL